MFFFPYVKNIKNCKILQTVCVIQLIYYTDIQKKFIHITKKWFFFLFLATLII